MADEDCTFLENSTLAALISRYSALTYAPCPTCTLAVLLDESTPAGNASGYFALHCNVAHTARPSAMRLPCAVCAALASYGSQHELPTTETQNITAVLLPGIPDNATRAAAVLMKLGISTAPGYVRAAVTAQVWEAAAELFYGGAGSLTHALEVAGALHEPPARTTA